MSDDVRELLDRLEKAQAAATPGVWKLWGMTVAADIDGTSHVDTATPVAQTFCRDEHGKPRTWDAALICEMQRNLPALVAALRGVLDLADEWDAYAAARAERGRPATGSYDDGVQRAQANAADRLRSTVAAALDAR